MNNACIMFQGIGFLGVVISACCVYRVDRLTFKELMWIVPTMGILCITYFQITFSTMNPCIIP